MLTALFFMLRHRKGLLATLGITTEMIYGERKLNNLFRSYMMVHMVQPLVPITVAGCEAGPVLPGVPHAAVRLLRGMAQGGRDPDQPLRRGR